MFRRRSFSLFEATRSQSGVPPRRGLQLGLRTSGSIRALQLISIVSLLFALALPSSAFALDFSGSGDTTVGPFYLPGGPTVFSWTETSAVHENFSVWLNDNRGAAVDLLVNELGYGSSGSVVVEPYSGTLPAGNYTLSVSAGGSWTMSLVPTSASATDAVASAIDVVSPNPASAGSTVSLSGYGTDSLGHAVTAYQWRSSINGVLSSSASFSTSSLSAGEHTIYFKVMCSNATWSPEVSTVLTVNGPETKPYEFGPSASPSTVAYNGYVTVKNTLRTPGGSLAKGRTLQLFKSTDKSRWTLVGNVYSSTGYYSRRVRITRRTYFKWRSAGDAIDAPGESSAVSAKSKALLTAPGVTSGQRFNKTYNATGYLKPYHESGSGSTTAYWYAKKGRSWVRVRTATVTVTDYGAYSKYSTQCRWGGSGSWSCRVRVAHADGDHVTTYSAWRYFTVR
jgi:hypothetical protein